MKKLITMVLMVCMICACSMSSAFAVNFTFDQIVNMIDAVAIDGERLFKDSFSVDLQSANGHAVVQLYWDIEARRGNLSLLDNDMTKWHIWDKIEGNNARLSYSVLLPILDPYVDYDRGLTMSFAIGGQKDTEEALVKIEYSPRIKSIQTKNSATYNEYYDDAASFEEAVERWFRVALDGESIDTVVQGRNVGSESKPVLQKGSKGEDVKKLQERLNELGYSVGSVDGDFGGKTKSAVEAFQQANGLEVTGVVDSETYERIFSSNAVAPTPTPIPKLSESECLKKAKDYIKSNYPGWQTILEPTTGVASKQVSVAFTLSNGKKTVMVVLAVDRTTGSITVER